MTGMVRASGPESPIATATSSDAVPASFKRMACSRPISQKGFMLIFAPSKITPVCSRNAFMQLSRREPYMYAVAGAEDKSTWSDRTLTRAA